MATEQHGPGTGAEGRTGVTNEVHVAGRPATDTPVPHLELDESVPPRPEEEIADAGRSSAEGASS